MKATLIRAEWLIDGNEKVFEPRVLVQDGVVTSVTSRRDPELDQSTRILNFEGLTLSPGLIDSHVHATLAGGTEPPALSEHQTQTAVTNLAAAASAGVTTVRDCGSLRPILRQVRDSQTSGIANSLIAGPALTAPGGHARSIGWEVRGVKNLRSAVIELARDGVDWIKVIGCGGGTPGTDPLSSTYSQAELRAVVDVSSQMNLSITLHALNPDTVRRGLAAGVRNFEHAWLYRESDPNDRGELAGELAEANAVICPTIWAIAHRIPILRRLVQASPGASKVRDEIDLVKSQTDLVLASVADCHAAGVSIIAGTDAGWRDVSFVDLPQELSLMNECGLTPAQALKSATSDAARALGVGGRKGRIAPGFDADLIATRGDPSVDLGALRRVEMTLVGGQPVENSTDKLPTTGEI
jgi:imidazolonepropionase-like amidohydrolase